MTTLRNTPAAWGTVAKVFHWIGALLALIVFHTTSVLRHHFWKRNEVLRRMWWSQPRPESDNP